MEWDNSSQFDATSYGSPGYGSLGTFDVDAAGRLSPSLPTSKLVMEFRWRDRPVSSSLHSIDDGASGVMTFRTKAGRMPSSAIAAAARPDAFGLLGLLPDLLPKSWKLYLTADHGLQLEHEIPVPLPALMSDLLIPAVQFCLAASPYLDLLEENIMGMTG
jgi:hypothetical protein